VSSCFVVRWFISEQNIVDEFKYIFATRNRTNPQQNPLMEFDCNNAIR